jgi:DnaJ-class molecular chaperone with C-terminal Zn finger domain
MNPFDILCVAEGATDEAIRKAYLAKLREFPPERAPARFEDLQRAFEAVKTHRDRLKYRVFSIDLPEPQSLTQDWLRRGSVQRPTEKAMLEILFASLKDFKLEAG